MPDGLVAHLEQMPGRECAAKLLIDCNDGEVRRTRLDCHDRDRARQANAWPTEPAGDDDDAVDCLVDQAIERGSD